MQGIKGSIAWIENKLLNKPNIELYFRLINAYSHLGMKLEDCHLVFKGLAISPKEQTLFYL